MAAHSKFGGSVIGRVISCPGSVALCETVPAKGSSSYAEEGTLAHGFAEYMLKQGDRDAMFYVGATLDAKPDAKPLTEEMAKAIQAYLDAVWAEHDRTEGAELYVEKGFELDIESAEPGEVFGTNDAMVYHPSTGRLVVFDYKHGVGVSVTAEDNAQLKFYAAGAVFANDWKVSELILTIVQPRARDADEIGAVREWPFEMVELLEFKAEVTAAIAKAKFLMTDFLADPVVLKGPMPDFNLDLKPGTIHYVGGPPYTTGSWCRWCDAAAICPAKQAQALEPFEGVQTVEGLTVGDLEDPKDLVPERLSRIVAGLSVLNAYANQCQEYLEALLMQGIEVPGWKVVEKIGRAKWVSDEQVIAQNLDLLYGLDEDLIRPRKLTTITEVEKLLKGAGATKSEIDDFKLQNTIKESSGLTAAPEGDRRPAINAAERSFGDVQV